MAATILYALITAAHFDGSAPPLLLVADPGNSSQDAVLLIWVAGV